jgi:hypothetical protein
MVTQAFSPMVNLHRLRRSQEVFMAISRRLFGRYGLIPLVMSFLFTLVLGNMARERCSFRKGGG